MSEERQYDRVITTQLELHALVSEALAAGVLDISNFKIDVDFNLVELLLAFGQEKVPLENDDIYDWFTVECPFSIDAQSTVFEKDFDSKSGEIVVNFNIVFLFNAIFNGKVDFTRAIFNRMVYFRNTKFCNMANFQNTLFIKEVTFSGATFGGGTDFRSAIFSESAYFDSTTFSEGKHYFGDTTFCETARFLYGIFEGKVEFVRTNFSGKAEFGCASFKQVYFLETNFHKRSSFNSINIPKNATLNFNHITTNDYFEISPVTIGGKIEIRSPFFNLEKGSIVVNLESSASLLALFPLYELFKLTFKHPMALLYFLDSQRFLSSGRVILGHLEVDQEGVCLKIRNLQAGSGVEVYFIDCEFYGKNVAFTNVVMKQVIINGGNDVSGMAFYRCEWESYYPNSWFNLCGWLAFRCFKCIDIEANRQNIADAYAQLKVSALDAGDAQLSNDFHFWHQWHQRKGTFWNRFYVVTSAYGLSAMLPLLWFIVIALLFTYIYGASFQQSLENGFLTSLSASVPFVFNDVKTIQDAIASIANMHNYYFYGLYILQHIIQGYLLFQIGAAIRNKVKR